MYEARITREHRTAFVILCDCSGSMSEEVSFRDTRVTKADAVAAIINMFIDELINRSRREEGVRDYFDIAVVEYSGNGVSSLFSERGFTTVSELVRRPVETVRQTILRTLPSGNQIAAATSHRRWVEPKAEGSTPMGEALAIAAKMVRQWCAKAANRQSYPPVVINITDGEASDTDETGLRDLAEKIRSTSTGDGNVLLFNIHLTGGVTSGGTVSFPSHVAELPDNRYARLLYDMSSVVPERYNELILSIHPDSTPPFRAMSFNCAIDEIFRMLTIGSLSVSYVV